jgi:hypothetical protein
VLSKAVAVLYLTKSCKKHSGFLLPGSDPGCKYNSGHIFFLVLFLMRIIQHSSLLFSPALSLSLSLYCPYDALLIAMGMMIIVVVIRFSLSSALLVYGWMAKSLREPRTASNLLVLLGCCCCCCCCCHHLHCCLSLSLSLSLCLGSGSIFILSSSMSRDV